MLNFSSFDGIVKIIDRSTNILSGVFFLTESITGFYLQNYQTSFIYFSIFGCWLYSNKEYLPNLPVPQTFSILPKNTLPDNLIDLKKELKIKKFLLSQHRLLSLLPDSLPEPENIDSIVGCSLLKTMKKFPEHGFFIANKNCYIDPKKESNSYKTYFINVIDNAWDDYPSKNTLISSTPGVIFIDKHCYNYVV